MAVRVAAALALGALLSLSVCAGELPATPAALPLAAPAGAALSTLFDNRVDDPALQLEALRASAARSWFEDQDRHARAALAALPGRAALRDRIDALTANEVHVDNAQFGGNRVFYLKRGRGANRSALYVRESLDGAERRVVEPGALEAGGAVGDIAFYRAAPNGKRVAYGLAREGSALAWLHVIDVDSGRELGPPLPVVSAGNPVQWRIDSGALFYAQRMNVPAGAGAVSRPTDPALWMREFDMDGNSSDHRLLARAVDAAIDLQADDRVRMHVGASSWAVVSATPGGLRDATLFVAPLASLHAMRPHWRKLLDAHAGVVAVALRGEWIYLLTQAGAPNGRIVRWSLEDSRPFVLADAEVVLETGERVITGISAARDALYVSEREAGVSTLMRLEYNVKLARPARRARQKTPASLPKVAGVARSTEVIMPLVGRLDELVTDPTRNGALVRLSGWTEAPSWIVIDGKGAVARTTLSPPSLVDFRDIVATRLVVQARDGGAVLVWMLQRRDIPHDGSAPTLLRTHMGGAAPNFEASRLAWLERGGLLVLVEGREAGDPGSDGRGIDGVLDDAKTGRDLVDVADFLVRNRWTRSAVLTLQGTAAGGLAVGNAMIERPELFRAIIGASGGEHVVLPMAAAYPAALLTARYDSAPAQLWQAATLTLALQAATGGADAGGRPVLLRVDFGEVQAGRDAANPGYSDFEADTYSFALWQAGDPAFTPAAR